MTLSSIPLSSLLNPTMLPILPRPATICSSCFIQVSKRPTLLATSVICELRRLSSWSNAYMTRPSPERSHVQMNRRFSIASARQAKLGDMSELHKAAAIPGFVTESAAPSYVQRRMQSQDSPCCSATS